VERSEGKSSGAYRVLWRDLRERNHLEDLGVNVTRILK